MTSILDPPTPSPDGSGIFFHTLRQANASAENMDADTDMDMNVAFCSSKNDNSNRPGTGSVSAATATATAVTSNTSEKDIEKDPERDLEKNIECAEAAASAAKNTKNTSDRNGSIVATKTTTNTTAKSSSAQEDRGWRKVVRNFTPSWFSVSMGTGVVSLLLHNLPYNADWVWYLSVVVFCLNIVLFTAFSAITITRYILYPQIWSVMIKHPSQSLFLGCIPMGFGTIVKMMVFVCTPWGRWAMYLTWALWWVDVAVACACSLIIPFVVVHHHRNQLSHMTAALLLPVVPVVVSSASGSLLAGVLPNRDHAIITLVTSYVLWGLGMVFSFLILSVYFLRLQIHDLPPREVIVSVFLPIGPLGQGGFAIQYLGKVAMQLLPVTGAFNGVAIDAHSPSLGPDAVAATAQYGGTVLYMLGILAGFVLWGAALGWLAFAVIAILTTKSFPFNMGWWGFVFPLGVFTSCTGMLATELSSTFFKVLTMVFSACVFCLWILVAVKTAIMVMHGDMFYAPCLRDLRPKEEQAGGNRTV